MALGLQFKRSVSVVALATALGATGLILQLVLAPAMAADIDYGGANDISLLQIDPMGNGNTYQSLYPNANATQSANKITVTGNTSSVNAVNGKDVWNTDATEGKIVVAPYVVYGGINIGANGTSGDNANGAVGANIAGSAVIVKNVQYDWTGHVAPDGIKGNNKFGGGMGAFGGGSILGGLSVGGLGGEGGTAGSGGAVTDNQVSLTNVYIKGSDAGNGAGGGAGGNGGIGGGSVFGGISISGASGISFPFYNPNPPIAGGEVIGNQINLSNVVLIGGAAGSAGTVGIGSAGGALGGIGGGSVFGGLSFAGLSGKGGAVQANTVVLSDTQMTGAVGGVGGYGFGGGGHGGIGGGSAFGGVSIGGAGTNSGYGAGAGGDVDGNLIRLTSVSLNGALGGAGNYASGGGGGHGGAGGGLVVGGASFGGSGIGDDIGGGKGGAVTANQIVLTNVTLIGAAGGAGSDATGGGGHGGIGGGSVIGGLSVGGSGGYSPGLDENGTGIGGFGGLVSQNEVIAKDVTLIGAKGGLGGEGEGGGHGSQGLEGGSILGGLSIGGTGGYGNGGNGGDVTGNKINISGKSLIWGNVYGGYSMGGAAGQIEDGGIGGATINNIVTLEGTDIKIGNRDENNNLTSYGAIYGGYSLNGDGSVNSAFDKVAAGNTLNLNGYRGTLSGIYNFENYNWLLPSNVFNGDTMVTIAENGTPVDLTNTKHSIAMYNDGSRLNVGDRVNLIDKTQGSWTASGLYTIQQGSFIIYEASLAQQADDNHALVLTINDKADSASGNSGGSSSNANNNAWGGTTSTGQSAARLNPQSKSYAEGRAAALAFANQGNDLIGSSINIIRTQAFAQGSETKNAFVPFILMNGSSQRYETGSHVDMKGFNMALGLALGFDFNCGHKGTVGAFFEYGRGTYDTYNNFTNYTSVYGDGNTNYKGGGIFGRIDFVGTGLNKVNNIAADQADGLYAEVSLRAGRATNKFDVGQTFGGLSFLNDNYSGSYESNSTYYGGHLAGGYVFNFDEKQSLDVYGRYLWTHMDSDTVTIGYERLHFDSSTSSRLQIGGRYGYNYNDQLKPYIGATYEHEFEGDISAKAYEFNLEKPSLKGDSGIFEAGFNVQPLSTNKSLSIDVNGQGYVGERQGGGGGVKVKYQF
ncbi:autotransporter outer membrane beta-barrel domain-containing protein [Bartonella sp. HY329]|uniref:autotransporter outer membrane beta-barrel domain-containing protein n=1 Tax=unclassified Bartonella TaxID=2645622 RepID=UPI0021C5A359|nr:MULTISPECIES: autotransporter outer membrane beta-barrel domain-containing protein [unclassified Bartonella]UXM94960.1 autotransporter outer membrane beta-barrel domain-containing protein [Bartonella sp. HY329]UXN09283.1 autotransporter outer membrane beta-barrel domain-containing protein [Bartonella sp. HY328]